VRLRPEHRRGVMHDCQRWRHRDVYGVYFLVPVAQEHVIEVGERTLDSQRESSCPSKQYSIDYDSALSPAAIYPTCLYVCFMHDRLAQRMDHPGASSPKSRRRCPTSR
jgi:hypothetical protein